MYFFVILVIKYKDMYGHFLKEKDEVEKSPAENSSSDSDCKEFIGLDSSKSIITNSLVYSEQKNNKETAQKINKSRYSLRKYKSISRLNAATTKLLRPSQKDTLGEFLEKKKDFQDLLKNSIEKLSTNNKRPNSKSQNSRNINVSNSEDRIIKNLTNTLNKSSTINLDKTLPNLSKNAATIQPILAKLKPKRGISPRRKAKLSMIIAGAKPRENKPIIYVKSAQKINIQKSRYEKTPEKYTERSIFPTDRIMPVRFEQINLSEKLILKKRTRMSPFITLGKTSFLYRKTEENNKNKESSEERKAQSEHLFKMLSIRAQKLKLADQTIKAREKPENSEQIKHSRSRTSILKKHATNS